MECVDFNLIWLRYLDIVSKPHRGGYEGVGDNKFRNNYCTVLPIALELLLIVRITIVIRIFVDVTYNNI